VKSEDELLIIGALAGDNNSCSLLFAKYWRRVFKFVRARVHDTHLAEDITQEVFVSAYQYMRTYKGELSGFYTWLCTIALNKASKRPYKEFNLEVEGYTSVTPETLLTTKQEFFEVLDAISDLPERQRKVFYMRHAQGMCYTDIGYALNMKPNYAKKLVYQVKKQVRSLYDQRRELQDDGGNEALPTP